FTYSSTLECTDCGKVVQVGTAGHKNLEAHRTSKACHLASLKRANGLRNKPEKSNQVIDSFFKPRAPLNPSTVSAPPPIRLGTSFTLAPERHMEPEPSQEFTTQALTQAMAVSLLRDLEEAIKRIPSDTPSATPEHPLSAFAIDP
ncbi:hypothetical protein EDB86DRAFT_2769537, partial [Lactarius hatsudake]